MISGEANQIIINFCDIVVSGDWRIKEYEFFLLLNKIYKLI